MEGPPPGHEENLIDLTDTSEAAILHSLQDRFSRKRLYTNVSGLLVAVNPFEKYSIYDDSVIAQYQHVNPTAHIFGSVRDAVDGVRNGSDAEIVIFSGESGSGKSHNAKQAMKYLAATEHSKVNQKHIDAIQTIFNSFGTARTVKNDSATRFGYAADFLFKKNTLSGLSIRTTLPLETIRVVSHKAGERNYNIFYEVYSGISSELKSKYGVRDGQKFFYMNQGKTGDNNYTEDAKNFNKLDESLEVVGFSEEQRQLIYKAIVAILHIGNIYYRQKRMASDSFIEAVEVGNETEVKWAAYLLEVDMSQWAPAFVSRTVRTEEGFSTTQYNIGQALDARDALSQMLYEELFNWILARIGLHLKCPDHTAVVTFVDCYGFEKYNNNGLEQLLINAVNEKLENVFVTQTFTEPMENYIREGVHAKVEIPQHLDNSRVVELLSKKQYGLLNLLDDECKFPKGSDESYHQHCNLNHLDKSIYGKARSKERLEFSVRHYAGNTWYSICDYVHKNRRSVPGLVLKTLSESQNSVISMLFRSIATGRERADYIVYSAQQFYTSANQLAEKILNGNSHFVRCIRSNNERQPARFDVPTVSKQIKTLGIADVIQFRLMGFPVRVPFQTFAQSYRCLLPSDIALCQNQKEIIIDILEGQGVKHIDNFKLGRNYVFLRESLNTRLVNARENARKEAGQMIQKTMRAYAKRKKYMRTRKATIALQSGLRGWKARKETSLLREELMKKLGKQSRKNKRLEAYHDGLLDPTKQENTPSTIVGYLDMDTEASDAVERASNKSDERPDTKKTSDYLGMPIKRRVTVETMSIEDFAQQYYKGHLLEVRREPIITPFLHKENDLDFRMSIEIFKLILKYMNDTKLNVSQLDELARYIVLQGINNPCQRDEILVQACNQCYRNRDKVAVERGRRLIQLSVASFPPTENIIPMLFSVTEDMPTPVKNYIQDTLQRRMKIPDPQTARLLPPSQLELLSTRTHHNSVVMVACHYGPEIAVEANPWITNTDVANRVLRQRGIGDPSGWTLELEGNSTVYSSTGHHFVNDMISELECGKDETKRSHFLSFPSDRTLPPVNKKREPAPEPVKIMSPVERRRARGSEGREGRDSRVSKREQSVDGSPRLERRGKSVDPSADRSYNRVPAFASSARRDSDDENKESDYCYTLPNKKKTSKELRSPNSVPKMGTRNLSPALERFKPYETITESPQMIRQAPTANHSYQKPSTDDRTELYVPNYGYTTQPNMPMIQYVPVMVPQHMMNPMMSSQMQMGPPMNYPMGSPMNYHQNQPMQQQRDQRLIEKNQQYDTLPVHQSQSSYAPTPEQFGSLGSGSNKEFDSIRSRAMREVDCDSRALSSRGEHVPSEYSSMSVASRIRRMPVPDNSRDVDRFLDEVFDQVLSPEDFKGDSMTARQIASSIKGGAGGPSEYDDYERPPYQDNYSRPSYDQPGNGYYQTGSDRYDYIDRERMGQNRQNPVVRKESRSRSLPRYREDYDDGKGQTLNTTNKSNGYSQIRESSVDRSPAMSRRGPPSEMRPPATPVPSLPPVPAANFQNGHPMIMMMPMQVSDNGQMMPMMMPQHMQMMSPNGMQPQMVYNMPTGSMPHSRHRSMDSYSRRSVTPDDLDNRQGTMNHRRQSPSQVPSRFESPRTMRAVLQQNRPQLETALPRIPKAPAPPAEMRSPATDRKLGLNRIPVDDYKEPVIQNTISNSEHLNPNKIRNPERNAVKEIQAREKEALRKINERLKNLPPAVENVRVFMPKKQPVLPVIEKKPAIQIPEEPEWTHPVYFPPPVPEPVKVEPPRSEWVFEGDVDRPPELQERLKTTQLLQSPPPTPVVVPILPPPSKQNGVSHHRNGTEQEKPAVKYAKQPWKLTIRKEMFLPSEPLDDAQVIDQVFGQIISDCRRAVAYRIRAYERDDVVAILKLHNVPPELLNRQGEIPTSIKMEVCEAARKWPLYFSQIFEVVEERHDESVAVLLSIAEHGIRLLMHTPADKENPLKVQDHFSYNDIAEATLESDELVCIHTRAGMSIRLRSRMATQIRNQIDKCLYGGVRVRQFVKAMADYVTHQPNLLSFRKGDVIELVGRPEGEDSPSDSWLYGKIGNQFGNLPSQYVVPLDENMSEIDPTPPPPLPMIHDDIASIHNDHHSFNGVFDDHRDFENNFENNRDRFLSRERVEKYTMLEFAIKYFRVPKGYDNTLRRGKKEWTWQEVAHKVKWTDKPITHSLLRLEGNELDKLAADGFLCIMRYMGDESSKKGESMTDTVYRLLLICHKNEAIRDEIYCQIIRQTTNNKSQKPESSIRGWRLFTILTAYFECTAALKPYLLSYLADNADDARRAYHGTAQLCLHNLRQTLQYGGRKYLLSGMEVEEITNGKILKRQQYMLPGGHKKVINTRSVTVVEEVIQELCNELNVRSPSEQQEFSLCYVTEKDNHIEYCSNNEYILDICTELDHKKVAFHFLLRRLVWVHPLRLDNPIYIDVMFFQLMPDYLKGNFISLQSGGNLSAATTDDVIQLGSLLHLAANEGRQNIINGKSVQARIPSTVLEHRIMHNESWADRISRRLNQMDVRMTTTQARAAFLDRLSQWPQFGVLSFPLDSCSVDGHTLPNLQLTVGKSGISLMAPLSHRVFEEFSYDKISATRLTKEDGLSLIEMIVDTANGSHTYEMRTSEASSINRLLSQYKFVVDENKGLLA